MAIPTVTAADVSVVIPTRNRWDILALTLEALRAQSTPGAEVIVVVNGYDQTPPPLEGARVIQTEDAGPGAGRNLGAQSSERRIILFLGDDTIPEPDLVERHVAAHNAFPADSDAILGLVQWHRQVAGNRLNRWLDWSQTQFDYSLLADQAGRDVGFGRMFTSNVSVKRAFLCSVGGFDTDFYFGYEDLDLGLRMSLQDMRLIYQPDALVRHLHDYAWPAIERRFEGVAAAERLMCHKHPGFEPFFLYRCQGALSRHRPPPGIARVADAILPGPGRLRRWVRWRGTDLYYRRFAREYVRRYEAAEALCDLVDYLDGDFTPTKLSGVRPLEVERDRLYPWTGTALSCVHEPALDLLIEHTPAGGSVIEWAGRDGSDGIALARKGFEVTFRDSDRVGTDYLRHRLDTRGVAATIAAEEDLPVASDAVLCLDQVETQPKPDDLLGRLEVRARVVVANAPRSSETGMNAAELSRYAAAKGLLGTATDRSGRTVVAYRGAG